MTTQVEPDSISLRERNGHRASQGADREEGSKVDEDQPIMNRTVYIKIFSACFGFFCAGVNDGSLGPLIPYTLRTYDLSSTMIGVIYACSFAGWFIAAVTNSHLMQYLDLGAMLLLGAVLQLLAQALRVWLPPFALFAISFGTVSLGQAFQDTHANTFVSAVKDAHRWLGLIHAMYMAGCLVGPLVATAIAATVGRSDWTMFYYVPLGIQTINALITAFAFRDTLRINTSASTATESGRADSKNDKANQEVKQTLSTPGVWLLSLFFFCFLGMVLTASGRWCSSFERSLADKLQDGWSSTLSMYETAGSPRWVMFPQVSPVEHCWDDCYSPSPLIGLANAG
jgi:fucose permease